VCRHRAATARTILGDDGQGVWRWIQRLISRPLHVVAHL
jgi:hypothetical protein